jgi:hypothetical protein
MFDEEDEPGGELGPVQGCRLVQGSSSADGLVQVSDSDV